jgi:hypothetical protein
MNWEFCRILMTSLALLSLSAFSESNGAIVKMATTWVAGKWMLEKDDGIGKTRNGTPLANETRQPQIRKYHSPWLNKKNNIFSLDNRDIYDSKSLAGYKVRNAIDAWFLCHESIQFLASHPETP